MQTAPPVPPPTRLAFCPDCDGILEATGFWPSDQAISEKGEPLPGAQIVIHCTKCDEMFGPVVFIARSGSIIATMGPGGEALEEMREAQEAATTP